MNKAQLVEQIAHKVNTTKAQAEAFVNAFTDVVSDCLVKGGDVSLIGFGSFKTAMRKARTGRNPQTGATIEIPGGKVVQFKVGSRLKERVKKG